MTDRYAELTELAGGFVHEMKNHLSTLGLNLQLLAEDFNDPQTQRERRALTRVQRLQNECHRLVEVSNDFLRFARGTEVALAPAELGRVLDEMIDFFGPSARAANIDVKTYVPANLPPVLLDCDLFKQALLNLLLNAEQAMPEGGELVLEASAEPAGCGLTEGAALASTVCLSLIDTGKGMPAEVCARIFEPFFSTKQGGTGLGLPTTRKIVEAHGGTIAVESAPGHGTKFTLRLRGVPSPLPLSPSEGERGSETPLSSSEGERGRGEGEGAAVLQPQTVS